MKEKKHVEKMVEIAKMERWFEIKEEREDFLYYSTKTKDIEGLSSAYIQVVLKKMNDKKAIYVTSNVTNPSRKMGEVVKKVAERYKNETVKKILNDAVYKEDGAIDIVLKIEEGHPKKRRSLDVQSKKVNLSIQKKNTDCKMEKLITMIDNVAFKRKEEETGVVFDEKGAGLIEVFYSEEEGKLLYSTPKLNSFVRKIIETDGQEVNESVYPYTLCLRKDMYEQKCYQIKGRSYLVMDCDYQEKGEFRLFRIDDNNVLRLKNNPFEEPEKSEALTITDLTNGNVEQLTKKDKLSINKKIVSQYVEEKRIEANFSNVTINSEKMYDQYAGKDHIIGERVKITSVKFKDVVGKTIEKINNGEVYKVRMALSGGEIDKAFKATELETIKIEQESTKYIVLKEGYDGNWVIGKIIAQTGEIKEDPMELNRFEVVIEYKKDFDKNPVLYKQQQIMSLYKNNGLQEKRNGGYLFERKFDNWGVNENFQVVEEKYYEKIEKYTEGANKEAKKIIEKVMYDPEKKKGRENNLQYAFEKMDDYSWATMTAMLQYVFEEGEEGEENLIEELIEESINWRGYDVEKEYLKWVYKKVKKTYLAKN